jgi:glycosyltransferase involved in cell wall biosynthesis/predicted N-acetyltransferase YhbS
VSPTEFSIVVAVYNEQEVLVELYRRLSAAMAALGRSYEIILVDDGSRDDSLNILLELQQRDSDHIRVFSFTRNFGHHIALTAGLDHAEGDVIVMMDADLQDQPEEIPKLLAKLDEGFDVVWGERETRQFKWYKNLSSHLFLWLMNSVARSEVRLDSSIFRAMRRTVADDLRELREKARYLPGLVRWLGYKQTSVPVVHGARFAGETKYSFWRLIKLALSTATSFSAAPLQFATVAGMGTAGLATLAVIYIIIRKILGGYAVPGYASIMIAIFFFGALQLIVIGLMGEYVSRIYREAQGRPLYLLRDLAMGGKDEGGRMRDEGRKIPSQNLSSLSSSEQEELHQVIASDGHLPLARVFIDNERDALADYHLASWKNADPFVFFARENDSINAAALLTELEWDTRVLGIRSGRILYANAVGGAVDAKRIRALESVLHNALQFSKERKLCLLDARVSSEDLFVTRAFESAGFHLVDLLVTLGARHEKFDRVLDGGGYTRNGNAVEFGNGLRVRPMRSEDEPILAQISEESFGDHTMIQDRFFLEPIIPAERSQDLFREWFSNIASSHKQSTLILAAELDGIVCGYIALEPMTIFGDALWWKDSLNAVAADARGRGVYRALVIAAFEYAREHEAAGLLTKTQASTQRVINTWLHLGGDILESAATLHWTSS